MNSMDGVHPLAADETHEVAVTCARVRADFDFARRLLRKGPGVSTVEVTWHLNLPELLGLPDAGLDDADVDERGNVFVSDGLNGRVYKLRPGGGSLDAFDVIRPHPVGEEEECSLNLAVSPDSTFCLADSGGEVIARYDGAGNSVGEFAAPGALSLCRGPDGLIYVLSSVEGIEKIDVYDELGSLVDTLPAPARHRAHLDPSMANLDSDPDGNVYVSYGMPPYRIWRVSADGSGTDRWSRPIDFPEDAVLIADIALDPTSRVLWALLACKQAGRQVLDAFGPDGEYLGSAEIPHSESLYGVICAAGGSGLCLLDTGSSRGAGDLMGISVSV
jgi:sugar lactone lactonase YvrE